MEHKKNLLSIYADDVHLVKEFYALKPNFLQVRIESNRIIIALFINNDGFIQLFFKYHEN